MWARLFSTKYLTSFTDAYPDLSANATGALQAKDYTKRCVLLLRVHADPQNSCSVHLPDYANSEKEIPIWPGGILQVNIGTYGTFEVRNNGIDLDATISLFEQLTPDQAKDDPQAFLVTEG